MMTTTTASDNIGLGVVRVKPLGAGGGGGERSAVHGASSIQHDANSVTVATKHGGKTYDYPSHIVDSNENNASMFERFMPDRIEGFLDGFNVNVMAYGQTGSGKTHTVFGPPGILSRAAAGEYGTEIHAEYGLFPRAVFSIFERVQELQALHGGSKTYVLTCAAVELGLAGNEDMFDKSGTSVAQTMANAQLGEWWIILCCWLVGWLVVGCLLVVC